ncbi:hypothetical protein O181_004715 [Austropuccinia psidii MF-1]|uniref:U3 small nucleolar RNA-associated protein 10 n=1 Tax=Austropuccinia psidii MF-1 TaxID=1389203 RepID=A0A9Q3BHJ0_9BASI|nr:hypothetical protein [Austropuccinia psidii MF-1]
MTSLQDQLAAIAKANPDVGRLKDLSRRDSYIYSPFQAAKLTLDQVHQIGLDGIEQLIQTHSSFQKYHHPLFGEASKRIDRTLLDPDQEIEVASLLEEFLIHLAPYLLIKPSAHALEWLVRRFRIHHFDVPTLISIFLPYHSTPQFSAMLNIIRLDPHPHLKFLKPIQTSRTGLPLQHLTDALLASPDLFRFVVGILPMSIKHIPAHQALLGFHLTTFLGLFQAISFQRNSKEPLPQPLLAIILPSLVEGIENKQINVRITSLIIVSSLVKSSTLENGVIQSLVKLIIQTNLNAAYPDIPPHGNAAWHEYDEAMVKTLVVLFQSSADPSQLRLSSKSCHSLTQIFKIEQLLLHISQTAEVSSFWRSLIQGLTKSTLKNETDSEDLLVKLAHLLVGSTNLTEITIAEMFAPLLSMDVPVRSILRPLGIFFQRHPQLVEQVAQNLLAGPQGANKDAVSSILRLLSGDLPLSSDQCTPAILHLSSSSALLRHDALKSMLEKVNIQLPSALADSSDILKSTVRTALMDPDPLVTQVLFSYPHAVLMTVSADDIFAAATSTLHSSKTSRSTLKQWVTFLTGAFLEKTPEKAAEIAQDLLLEKLFWTKSGAKATAIFWTNDHNQNLWKGTILEGIWPAACPSENPQDRVKANETLLDGICSNFLKLGDSRIVALLRKLNTQYNPEAPLTRLVPLLVLWRMTTHLSEAIIGALINSLIEHMINNTDAVGLQQWLNIDVAESDSSHFIIDGFYSKPSSEKLFHRLTGDILRRAVSQAHRLKLPEYCWFQPNILQASVAIPCDTLLSQPADIAKLYFKLYTLGHSGGHQNSNSLGQKVLLTLFREILKEECLTFLARIWTSSSFHSTCRVVALLDAAVEVKAIPARCSASTQNRKDYQLLIPSLLIGLSDTDKGVRSAAIALTNNLKTQLAAHLSQNSLPSTSETTIYAYDMFYGIEASAGLQYLSLADFNQFITLLHSSQSEIIANGLSQIRILLEHGSLKNFGLGSKDKLLDHTVITGTFKRKILSFLLNVVQCWNEFEGRVNLLKCVRDMTDTTRLQYVVPLVDEMLSSLSTFIVDDQPISRDALMEYAMLLFQAYDSAEKVLASGKDISAYDVLIRALQCNPTQDAQLVVLETTCKKLQNRLFAILPPAQQENILRKILALASSSHDHVGIYVTCLRNLPLDTACFTQSLSSIAKEISLKMTRSNKKSKTNQGSIGKASSESPDLLELTTLLEAISMDKLQHTFKLFSVLLDTLALLLTLHANCEVDIHFSAQLLILSLTTVIPNLTVEQFRSEGLNLTPIVDYMRISLDPHVSQQTILLLAELAPLCPELICQSMMPIFTFVGAHVIERDDSYSARVVDKAIQALIPPIVDAAHAFGSSRIELILSLRELLLMFVGARDHIPKHRRTRLFVRLIENLSPYNFLGAILALIIDADIRKGTGNLSFELPLAIWDSFSSTLDVAALAHIVAEIKTLLQQSPNQSCSILPHESKENAMNVDADEILRDECEQLNTNRVRALLKFMDDALGSRSLKSKLDSARSMHDTETDQVLAYLMSQVLDISQPNVELAKDEHAKDALAIARKTAKLVSLPFFSSALLERINDENKKLVSRTFALLRTRLLSVRPIHRPEVAPCVEAVIDICVDRIKKGIVASATEQRLTLLDAIETLGAIAEAPTPSEQSLLSQVYSPLLNILSHCQDNRITLAVLSLLIKLCHQLGSRLIPQIRATLNTCAEIIQKNLNFQNLSQCAKSVSQSFQLIEATMKTSPSFILPHIYIILGLLTGPAGTKSDLKDTCQASLIRCLTKTVPLHNLEPALSSFWTTIKVSADVVLPLMGTLLCAIKRAQISEVTRQSKAVFHFLLRIFDLRKEKALCRDGLARIESIASKVFLSMVMKLNDQTLKPLLFRLIDWATVELPSDENQGRIDRSVTLYQVFHTLLSNLQTLAVPYLTHLVDYTVGILNDFAQGRNSSLELWVSVASVVEQGLSHDSEGFWNFGRLSKITSPILCQLRLASQFNTSEFSLLMRSLIRKLARHISHHDTLLKVLNSGVLDELKLHDRVQVKLLCLQALEEMWEEIGAALIPFVPETVGGSLIEALEESDGGIDLAAKQVVKRIELELGESIETYLA